MIRHCGRRRRSRAYWLTPTDDEDREIDYYKWVVAEVLEACPACGQSVIEWHGINYLLAKTPPHRIAKDDHEAWKIRIRTGLDDEMDSSQWDTMMGAVYWVYGSMHCWPYVYGRRQVR